ncbi:MAG: GPW/gp25 family protein [Firmicutes bacterium]|nr:GPW/gp25 family protein [[Eubacterium] siraeum]MCM1486778.1 GPW/gp25 family protein [Bacillota bacterium]
MELTVDSEKDYSQELMESDLAKSVVQNIALLLNTKKGTVPMYREYGLPMEFIDKPLPAAQIIAFAEITEALEKFEPRAKLTNMTFRQDKNGKMAIVLEVTV